VACAGLKKSPKNSNYGHKGALSIRNFVLKMVQVKYINLSLWVQKLPWPVARKKMKILNGGTMALSDISFLSFCFWSDHGRELIMNRRIEIFGSFFYHLL
jgi:hypothetical protein